MFIITSPAGANIAIQEINKINASNRAIGFLTDLNKKITQQGTNFSWWQEKAITSAVNGVVDKCRAKNPWMYQVQSTANPLSSPYQIESLANKILSTINKKTVQLVQEAEDNQDLYEFFPVSSDQTYFIKNSFSPNLAYLEYSPSLDRVATDFHRMYPNPKDQIPFILEVDQEKHFARILRPKDLDGKGFDVYQGGNQMRIDQHIDALRTILLKSHH